MTIEHITDTSFGSEVLGSDQPFLLVFSAAWCGPCKAFTPILTELAAEHAGRLRIGKIDLDDSPAVASQLGVRGVPTVVLFRCGQERGRLLGLNPKRKLLALVGLPASAVDPAPLVAEPAR
jgi:thioredoxin 1